VSKRWMRGWTGGQTSSIRWLILVVFLQQISQEQVTRQLWDTLSWKRSVLAGNPDDAQAQVHVGILEQVRVDVLRSESDLIHGG
jgi:hypothetical protein